MLRRDPLFASLADAQVKDIIVNDPILAFGDEETIVREGDAGDSMFVVLEGACTVVMNATSEFQPGVELAELSQGDVFGEMAALTNEPRVSRVNQVEGRPSTRLSSDTSDLLQASGFRVKTLGLPVI